MMVLLKKNSVVYNIKMFKDKPKNAFLQKKNQEKAKAAEKQKYKINIIKLQANIRAMLVRSNIDRSFNLYQNMKLSLIMKKTFKGYSKKEIDMFVKQVSQESEDGVLYFLEQFVLQNALEVNST